MLKNKQLKMITGKSLLEICTEKIHEKINTELESEFFIAMFSLLEETERFGSVKKDFPIDRILSHATDDVEAKLALYELIGLVTSYWKPSDENFSDDKQELVRSNSFFSMIFDVIEDEEKFCNEFFANHEKLEEILTGKPQAEVQRWKSKFSFILLLTAMKNDRLRAIEFILSNDPSVMDNMRFPQNIELRESSFHFALKSLERGYDISTDKIPSSWISPKVFKKFLDSRIRYDGGDLVELDCGFLKGGTTEEISSQAELVFNENTKCLDHILKSEALVSCITHPIIASFVELKSFKHRGIHKWNFWLFIICFMIPFGSLLLSHYFINQIWNPSESICFWIQLIIKLLCALSITFLYFNEFFWYRFIEQSLKDYWKRQENRLRIALVIVAVISFCLILFSLNNPVTNYFVFLLSFLTISNLFVIYPMPSKPLHQIMMKKIAIAIFNTFICCLVACSVWKIFEKIDQEETQSYNQSEIKLKPG